MEAYLSPSPPGSGLDWGVKTIHDPHPCGPESGATTSIVSLEANKSCRGVKHFSDTVAVPWLFKKWQECLLNDPGKLFIAIGIGMNLVKPIPIVSRST